jgi:hypothetical protein
VHDYDRYVQHGSSWGDGVIYIYIIYYVLICSNDSALFGALFFEHLGKARKCLRLARGQF